MAEQDPTPWELMRAIRDVQKSISDLTDRLDKRVSYQLFAAYQAEVERRFSELKEDVSNRKIEHDTAMGKIAEDKKVDNQQRQNLRNSVILAVVIAILGFISSLVINVVAKGGS